MSPEPDALARKAWLVLAGASGSDAESALAGPLIELRGIFRRADEDGDQDLIAASLA